MRFFAYANLSQFANVSVNCGNAELLFLLARELRREKITIFSTLRLHMTNAEWLKNYLIATPLRETPSRGWKYCNKLNAVQRQFRAGS